MFYVLLDKVNQRRIDMLYVCVIAAPAIDGKLVLCRKVVLQEEDVWCIPSNVHHALEANVFVKPDRPAQAILSRIRVSLTDAIQ